MFNYMDYFKQSPLVPLIFCSLLTVIILMQCFTKHRFLKVRLIISFLLTFLSALILAFNNEIKTTMDEYQEYINFILLGIEVIVCILLFTTIDLSLSNEKLQRELTKSLDETKYYVLLDKKDKIKEISSLLIKDLGIEASEAIGKNFFDVIEMRYSIIGFNGEEAFKNDLKKYFNNYGKKVTKDQINTLELSIQDDNAVVSALYFNESVIFSNEKYKGRVLIGDKKNEESLMGTERELALISSELDIIKNRFITILNKTSDGIYFNNLSQKSIWFNDILVKRLCLNGNSINLNDFYRNIHQEDIALYQDIMNNMKSDDYTVTYRYNTGAYYVYVKEEGHKIISDKTIELCGIMSVLDDYRYEKTETSLDSVGTESEMLARFKALQNSDTVFQVVHFKVASIPDINEKYGRAIGNMMLSKYVQIFKEKFVIDNFIFRVSGLEFVAFITNYNKMETLKTFLKNDEKILHLTAEYIGQKITADVFMGISYSNDTANPKDALSNAKDALRICSNPQFSSSYAYYRDIK
ncbi:MAG: diguanylate cyclase [Acholeplasmatales bacterium]|nr:diguanylate cyclase [Acholeplasmatales bacterium]